MFTPRNWRKISFTLQSYDANNTKLERKYTQKLEGRNTKKLEEKNTKKLEGRNTKKLEGSNTKKLEGRNTYPALPAGGEDCKTRHGALGR